MNILRYNKIMNGYSIYCTPEQTKKALELGAPINTIGCTRGEIPLLDDYVELVVMDDNTSIIGEIPSAEQMINWLEEQKIYFSITCIGDYVYEVWIKDNNNNGKVIVNSCVPSRKEATLAAIDAALKYLIDNSSK